MPQVNPGRDHGPRPATGSPSRPGPASQFGPGGRPLGPGADSSRVFRCPGCNEAFGSQYALRQHRKRFLEQHSESPAGAAAGPLRETRGCVPDARRPIVSRWQSAGQRAGGGVQNTTGGVSRALQGLFAQSDSESEVSDPPSRMRSPNDYEPSPEPDAAAVPAARQGAPFEASRPTGASLAHETQVCVRMSCPPARPPARPPAFQHIFNLINILQHYFN
jgi:hypothetical protein